MKKIFLNSLLMIGIIQSSIVYGGSTFYFRDTSAIIEKELARIAEKEAQNTPAPTIVMSAGMNSINYGESTVLTWATENALSCSASGDWSGDKTISGSEIISPLVSSTYNLSCSGNGGSISDSVAVAVSSPPPPTITFSPSTTIVNEGESLSLSWNSANTTNCTASGAWNGNKSLSGSETISPQITSTYTLTCTGLGGNIDHSLEVIVNPAPPELELGGEFLNNGATWSGETGVSSGYVYKQAGTGTYSAMTTSTITINDDEDFLIDMPYYIWSYGTSYYGFVRAGIVKAYHYRDGAKVIQVHYNGAWRSFNIAVKGYSNIKVYFKPSTSEIFIWRNNILVKHITGVTSYYSGTAKGELVANNLKVGIKHAKLYRNVTDRHITETLGLSLP